MNLPTFIKSWSLTAQISTPWFNFNIGVYLRLHFGFYQGPDQSALWIGPIGMTLMDPYQYEDEYPYNRKTR